MHQKHPLALGRNLAQIAVFAGLAYFLAYRIVRDYGPWAWGPSSDSTTPWFMVNLPGPWRADYLYLFGQDRCGGLPLILMRLLRGITQFTWTLEHIQWGLAVAAVIGGLFFARLAGTSFARSLAVFAIYTLALLYPQSGFALVQSSAYVWQLPVLFGAFYALHLYAETPKPRHFALLSLAAFLAIWASPTSAIYLVIAAFVLHKLESKGRAGFPMFYAIGLGKLMEMSLYQVHAHFAYNSIGPTLLSVEIGADFFERLAKVFEMFFTKVYFPAADVSLKLDWAYFANVALAVGVGLAWFFAKPSARQEFLTPLYRRRLLALALYATLIVVVETLAITVIKHFRVNRFDPRYLTMLHVFTITGFFSYLIALAPGRPLQRLTLALPCVLLAWLAYDSRHPIEHGRDEFTRVKTTSEELEAEALPGDVLLGGYWAVYRLIPFQVQQKMIPVVLADQLNRLQWLNGELKRARRIIAYHSLTKFFGPPREPFQSISNYGVNLRYAGKLENPNLYDFSIYYVED